MAVLIGTLEVGGAELDIVRNFPRLNRDEFDVVVVVFGPAGPLAPELERQGIRVVSRVKPLEAGEVGERRTETARGPRQIVYGWYSAVVMAVPESVRRPLKRVLKEAPRRAARWARTMLRRVTTSLPGA